jgi:hypothetical protein
MSTAIQNTHIEIGDTGTSPPQFEPDCIPGDWQSYQLKFDTPFQDAAKVRVIVTANNENIHPSNHNPAVVGVVTAVSTTGFTLWARNSDCNEGLAGFYFMAVEELGQPPPAGEGVDLRYGILQQKSFRKDCEPGDSQKWFPRFSSPFPSGERVALATGCNLNVRDSNVPAVGISRNLDVNGFELAARNSATCMPLSGTTGACAFYYVAGVEGVKPKPDNRIWIDSGVVSPKHFGRACKTSSPSWLNSWEVYFSKPFLTPSVVLLTCRDADVVAVVGLAQDVTTHGFTLAGFNSDCFHRGGRAQFNWVAIGCGQGCG